MVISAVEQITVAPEDGPQGKPGPLPYPAGQWHKAITYVRDEQSTPIVLYVSDDGKTKDFYILVVDGGGLLG
ncbi:MAG: hypothetical protein LIP01_11705 [Tannerellaceae bacterium]|nr:hypothetical protein [Tannerellaceae bacterium]